MNYLLNVDGLEYVGATDINLNNYLSGSIYKFPNGLILERVKDIGKLKHYYGYGFKILYKGDEIGFFYTKTLDLSYSLGFNSVVKIDNKVFYTKSIDSINKLIVEALELTTTKISRLDIAYDTDTDVLTKFKTLYNDSSTKFRFMNKIIVGASGRLDPQIPVGSLKSRTRCILIYNKTDEIKAKHKDYIRNTHNKVFGINNIYRVELRIMSKTLEIGNIDIMNLDNEMYLESIYNTYLDDLIYFTETKSNSKIEYITLNNTGMKLSRTVKQKIKCGGKQVKMVINFIDRECNSLGLYGVKTAWKLIRSTLIKKYGLETWYLTRKQ